MSICLTAPPWCRVVGLCAWVCCATSWAQLAADDPDWKESQAPAPPAFELKRLVPFEVSSNSTLKWGFDPETMTFTSDGLVRYVVVAQSPSGVVNAMYEAVRCTTGEWKTYARHNKDSGWSPVTQPQWQPIRAYQPSHHALRLAQQGVCTGSAPALSVREVVQSVKQHNSSKAR